MTTSVLKYSLVIKEKYSSHENYSYICNFEVKVLTLFFETSHCCLNTRKLFIRYLSPCVCLFLFYLICVSPCWVRNKILMKLFLQIYYQFFIGKERTLSWKLFCIVRLHEMGVYSIHSRPHLKRHRSIGPCFCNFVPSIK